MVVQCIFFLLLRPSQDVAVDTSWRANSVSKNLLSEVYCIQRPNCTPSKHSAEISFSNKLEVVTDC
jgi:hypothetical protein